MKRMVTQAIISMVAKSLAIALIAGTVIGLLGYFKKWHAPFAYSNAFFLAGLLLIVAGASTHWAAGQGWQSYQATHMESFRDMSPDERANYIVNLSSAWSKVILGVLSGLWLIAASAIAAYAF